MPSGGEGTVEELIPDGRSFEQRDFDTLMGLTRTGVHAGSNYSPGGRATVTATVTLTDPTTGVGGGWVDDIRDSIPLRSIHRPVCDAGIEIAITRSNGALVALTSTQDMFTRRQHRALAARDGGCVWPTCRAPASWADAHHITHREHGGPTNTSNGVHPCPTHHRMLHTSTHQMTMIHGRPHPLAPPPINTTQQWRAIGQGRLELLQHIRNNRDDDPDPAATTTG